MMIQQNKYTKRQAFRLLSLVGIVCLAACTNNEITGPEAGQMPISFSGNMPKEVGVSRADVGLEEVLNNKTFKAWGYKNTALSGTDYTDYQTVMSGYNVNYQTGSGSDSNTHDWEYVNEAGGQYIKYWDFSAYAYRFFAYAKGNSTTSPATEAADVTEDVSDPAKVSFSSNIDCSSDATLAAVPYFSKLWFSNDKANDYGKVVTLRFIKPFARVRFIFKFNENLTFGRESLSQIKFYPNPTTENPTPSIATAGNVTVSYPLKGTETKESWSTTSTASIPQFDIDWYETPASVPAGWPTDALPTSWPNTPEKWYYVMPAPNQGSYSVQVQVVTGEPRVATVPAEYMNWQPGYEYTYVFKITEQGGVTIDVIQVAVNNWNKVITLDHEVYNW